MAARITVEANNNTGAGLRSASDDVRRLAGGLDQATVAAKKTAKAVGDGDGGSGGDGIAAAFAGLGGAITTVKAGMDGVKKIAELTAAAINALKDNGNSAAADLSGSFDEVQKAMLDLANDPGIRQMFRAIAATIRSDVIPAIKSIDGEIGKMLDTTTSARLAWMVMSGQITKMQAEVAQTAINGMKKIRDAANEVEVAQEKGKRAADAVEEAMQAAGVVTDELDKKSALLWGNLDADIAAAKAKIRDLSESNTKDSDKIKEAQKELTKLLKMEKEQKEQIKDLDETRAQKAIEDLEKRRERSQAIQNEEAERQRRIDEEKMRRQVQAFDLEMALFEKRKQQLEDPAKKLMNNVDPGKVRGQYVRGRVDKELFDFDFQGRERIKGIQGDKSLGDYERSQALNEERNQQRRDRQQLERRTRTGATRQFDRGGARDEDVADAVANVANGQVDNLRSRGVVDKAGADAMKSVIAAQTEQSKEMANLRQMYDGLQQDADANAAASRGRGMQQRRERGARQ